MRVEAQSIPVMNTMPHTRDDRLAFRRPVKGTGCLTVLAGFASSQRREFGATDLNVYIPRGFVYQTLCRGCDAKESTAPPKLRISPHEDASDV
jgi:hypothetical protein